MHEERLPVVSVNPCPECGAHWRRTELIGEAIEGGGYHVVCHGCGHQWDDVDASHGARAEERKAEGT